jgi:hypothetical protein
MEMPPFQSIKLKNLSLSYDIFRDFANEMHLSLAEKGINEKRSPLSLRGAKHPLC